MTKLNGEEFLLNADLIESITVSPDTLIQLTNGKKMMVAESPVEVRAKVIDFRREVFSGIKIINTKE